MSDNILNLFIFPVQLIANILPASNRDYLHHLLEIDHNYRRIHLILMVLTGDSTMNVGKCLHMFQRLPTT